MIEKHIAFSKTGLYKPLIEDYLRQKEAVKPLVNHFFSEESILNVIKQREDYPIDRRALYEALKAQYASSQIKVPEHITQLKDKNTFTVTTGHQLSLFGGPMFFVYKIIAVINLAKRLKHNHPEYNFIPVFWMASEDHDFEEIQSVKTEGKTFKWETNQTGAVGRFVLDEKFSALLNTLKKEVSNQAFASNLIQLMDKSYSEGRSLAQATRLFVHSLFSETELIIIDGDDQQLKSQFYPIAQKEFNEKVAYKHVSATNDYLTTNGYHTQVHVREVNLFSLEDGTRELIENKLPKNALDVSPNALLRPVYQEFVLPNIAYIGGAGEMAYWFQLKSTFEAFNVSFPALVVRNSVVLTSTKTNRNIEKIGLKLEDVFTDVHELQKIIAKKKTASSLAFDDELAQLKAAYAVVKDKAAAIDLTLKDRVGAQMKSNQNFLLDLEKRLIRYRKKQLDVDMNRLDDILNEVFPNGVFQERQLSFFDAYAKFGSKLIHDLSENINVLDQNIKVLEV